MIDIIELRDGTSIKWQPLTQNEYDSLLKKAVKEPIGKYINQYGIEVRLLDSQQIIAKDRDYYGLYFSLSDFDRVLADFEKSGSHGTEILLNKNKYGKSFPEKTGVLINELSTALDIEDTIPSEALLRIVDTKICELQDPNTFRKQHLINFIALVGEALIKKHNAKWEMKLASDKITWNPYLVIRRHQVPFFTYLYEDIFLNQNTQKTPLIEVYETVNDIEKHNLG